MHKNIKKAFSYIIPFRLKSYTSKINGNLEINLINGKKTLDTNKSNYSYGSLQKILHKGLLEIGFSKNIEKILVLGLGGGSIVQTIRKDFNSSAFIELVDIDSEIISIAINEFEINRFKNINIIHSDASDYLKNNNDTFDLIIIDIFIINTIPEIFTEIKFINSLTTHLNPNGKIIYNTMKETMTHELFSKIKNNFLEEGLKVKVIEKVEETNDLIIAEKQP
ncbi:MAG: fused MFS/spermidine synthase [Bacteroidales bacterium]|jgi:spermidine synthase